MVRGPSHGCGQSDHKVQSDDGSLRLTLEPVPKLIHVIAENWAPQAFTVSFKLETDPGLLLPKAQTALRLYNHNVVVANLLRDRKREVMVVQAGRPVTTLRVDSPATEEIEEQLVARLVALHTEHLCE